MIKVNLLRNIGGAQSVVTEGVSKEVKNQAGLKLFVVLLCPALLFAYERMNTNELQNNLAGVRAKLAQVLEEKSSYGDTAPRVERYNKEKVKVDQELAVIRNLARARLKEVKALDALQSLVPNRTWVRQIKIEGNVVSLEGFTNSDEGIADLIRALENSVYFSQVEPKSTSQERLAIGPVKKFVLEFQVGKQN